MIEIIWKHHILVIYSTPRMLVTDKTKEEYGENRDLIRKKVLRNTNRYPEKLWDYGLKHVVKLRQLFPRGFRWE